MIGGMEAFCWMTPNQVCVLPPVGNSFVVFPVVLSLFELLQLLHTAWLTIPLSCCNVNISLSGSVPSAHAVHIGRRF